MTLSVAWVRNGDIDLLCDSRMSSGIDKVDFAIKISEIFVNQLVGKTLGLAYAGDTALDQTLRDRLSAILSIATYNPIRGIASFSDCANLAAQIHQALAKDFKKAWGVEAEFLLLDTNFFDEKMSLILLIATHMLYELGPGIHFIGDNEAVEEANLLSKNETNPYLILKKVIENRLLEKVGGAIQAGIIEKDHSFRLKGICIPGDQENKFYFAGAPIEHYEDFIPTTSYLDPFGCGAVV
jgi:hypothetical protein